MVGRDGYGLNVCAYGGRWKRRRRRWLFSVPAGAFVLTTVSDASWHPRWAPKHSASYISLLAMPRLLNVFFTSTDDRNSTDLSLPPTQGQRRGRGGTVFHSSSNIHSYSGGASAEVRVLVELVVLTWFFFKCMRGDESWKTKTNEFRGGFGFMTAYT